MRSNAEMANRQGDVDLLFAQVDVRATRRPTFNTLDWLGVDTYRAQFKKITHQEYTNREHKKKLPDQQFEE